MDFLRVVGELLSAYRKDTPQLLKIVDVYLFYVLITGIIQFVYCALVGTFPFNSFLSGFISTVGSFVLGGMFIPSSVYNLTPKL
jgi:oligosaccharyltransferase complex subunit epsilon